MISSLYLANPEDTDRLAAELAACFRAGDVVCMVGDLGTGKTSFCRSLIRALLQNPDLPVPSPTFTLLQEYQAPQLSIRHYDLYRIKNPDEIFDLGWEDNDIGLTVIEWPERLGRYAPENALSIILEHHQTGRLVTIQGNPAWQSRLTPVWPAQ